MLEFEKLFDDRGKKWIVDKSVADMEKDSVIANSHKVYEMTPGEIQHNWMKKLHHLWFNYKDPKDHEFYFTGEGDPEISVNSIPLKR